MSVGLHISVGVEFFRQLQLPRVRALASTHAIVCRSAIKTMEACRKFWLRVVLLVLALVFAPRLSAGDGAAGVAAPTEASRQQFERIKLRAEQGDVTAQVDLGLCYMKGEGVSRNPEEAVWWFRKAAAKGSASAQQSLGTAYSKGNGVPKDDNEAFKWFRQAAEQGDAYAQNDLGLCYGNGEGVAQDLAEAVKWFTKSAKQGNAAGQYDLGVCYATGKGVPKDDVQALKWLRQAAEQGYGEAQTRLGAMLELRGEVTEAAEWYHKGACQGVARAQFGLAGCYSLGRGVVKDYVEAYKWLVLSGAGGVEESTNVLKIIEKMMTPEQVLEGQRRAGLLLQHPKTPMGDKAEPGSAAKGRESIPSDTNRTPSAAGSPR